MVLGIWKQRSLGGCYSVHHSTPCASSGPPDPWAVDTVIVTLDLSTAGQRRCPPSGSGNLWACARAASWEAWLLAPAHRCLGVASAPLPISGNVP